MAPSDRLRHSPIRLALAVLLSMMAIRAAAGSIPMTYCSSINTASMPANLSTYQSDGLCRGFCSASYAFAIVQEKSCWCSDDVPDPTTQVSVDRCSNSCPGFPSDVCGGDGLFGYIQLSIAPSGTAGAAAGSSVTSSVSTVASVVQSSSTISLNSSTSAALSTSLPSGMTTLPPTITTVTAGGKVQTVTVTPTVAIGSANSAGVSSNSGGLSTGAAVGVAVGIVALVAFLAGIGLFLFFRRRRNQEAEEGYDAPSARGSSSGMMNTTPKTEMSESRYAVGPDGRPVPENWETDTQGRRRSKLMPVDPRMNPFGTGIYARDENKSHDSVHTMRDDQDYSRRVHEPAKILRATNPDPDPDP